MADLTYTIKEPADTSRSLRLIVRNGENSWIIDGACDVPGRDPLETTLSPADFTPQQLAQIEPVLALLRAKAKRKMGF